MRLRLEIDCGNAAFGEDGEERAAEVARILRELADRIERRGPPGYLPEYANAFTRTSYLARDKNGNTVAELWRRHPLEKGRRRP